MPLYEYRCLKCEHVMEVLQKHDDPPLRRCKECSGKVEKLISRTSFQLKGGGWFDQGYGGGSSKGKTKPTDKTDSTAKPAKTKTKSKSDSGSSSSSGSDS